MTEGMPQLIAAEIDSYDQVLQRAIKAEQELAAAEAENKQLRAGEGDDEGDPSAWPTPPQWIRRFNEADAETRLRVVATMLADSAAADSCHQGFHEQRLREAFAYHRAWLQVGELRDSEDPREPTSEQLDAIDAQIRASL